MMSPSSHARLNEDLGLAIVHLPFLWISFTHSFLLFFEEVSHCIHEISIALLIDKGWIFHELK